jgi:hypothetical protein
MNIREMAEALLAALDAASEKTKAYKLGDNITPPGFVLGPPSLLFEGYGTPVVPTSAVFTVWVVVDANEWSMERLWDLVPLAVTAVESVVDAGVERADPATFPLGDLDLPAYSLTVPVTLS